MFITSTPVDKTPSLKKLIRSGVVSLISPLMAISLPPDLFTNVPNAFPKETTTSGGKSSATFPLISYSLKIYGFTFIFYISFFPTI